MCPQWSALDLGSGLFSISALKACGMLLRMRSTHLGSEPMYLYITLWDHSSDLCCSPWLSGAYISGLSVWEFSLPSLPLTSHDGVYISGTSRQMTEIYFRSYRDYFNVFRITNPLVRERVPFFRVLGACLVPGDWAGKKGKKKKRDSSPLHMSSSTLLSGYETEFY